MLIEFIMLLLVLIGPLQVTDILMSVEYKSKIKEQNRLCYRASTCHHSPNLVGNGPAIMTRIIEA